ncbi:hypothetical protein T265_15680, partial [Opisthorchis viverrini]
MSPFCFSYLPSSALKTSVRQVFLLYTTYQYLVGMQCITEFNGSKPMFIDGCKYCVYLNAEKEPYSCDIDDTCDQFPNQCCDTEFCNINKTMDYGGRHQHLKTCEKHTCRERNSKEICCTEDFCNVSEGS